MEEFPPEIIEKILSQLPAESLLCLKTVCKSWNSIINTHEFIKTHLNQTLMSNSHRRLLRSSMDSKKRKLSFYSADLDSDSRTDRRRLSYSMLNHPLEVDYATVFGSCNGVVSILDFSKPNNVLLYNPFTKSRRILPAPSYNNSNNKWELVDLLYGFGYDSKTEDYKVLRIVEKYRYLVNPPKSFYEADHVCSVYSLNKNCWKSVSGTVLNRYAFSSPSSHGVLVNETLHYPVMSTANEYPRRMIVCFDLRTDSSSLMDCPNHDDKNNNNLIGRIDSYLAELDGCLCVMFMYFNMNNHNVRADLLVMKEYGNKESWSKVFSIRNDQLTSVCKSFRRIKPITYSKDRRRILIDIDGGFVTGWFDLESKKFKKHKHRGMPFRHFDTSSFMGSLVSFTRTK